MGRRPDAKMKFAPITKITENQVEIKFAQMKKVKNAIFQYGFDKELGRKMKSALLKNLTY